MKMTLIVPPKVQTATTGYRGSLKKTYYGKEYEFKFSDGGCEVYRDGAFVPKSDVESGQVPTKLLVAAAATAQNFKLVDTENA